jgi:hypothetical protein
MTEQREPSSRLWVSSRWHWLLLIAIPSLPLLVWSLFAQVERDTIESLLLLIASFTLAVWWLPLALRYLTLVRCARVWIDGDELIYRRWWRTRSLPIDDDLRLRGAGMIHGASKQEYEADSTRWSRSSIRFNAFVFLAESIFGPLHRECFELYRKSEGRNGQGILFYHPARFKSAGESFQPGMQALRAKLAALRAARKAEQVAKDAHKRVELEQAQQDERAAIADLANRAKVSRNPIKRMRELRKERS